MRDPKSVQRVGGDGSSEGSLTALAEPLLHYHPIGLCSGSQAVAATKPPASPAGCGREQAVTAVKVPCIHCSIE